VPAGMVEEDRSKSPKFLHKKRLAWLLAAGSIPVQTPKFIHHSKELQMANKTKAELLNEIKQLQADKWRLYDLEGDYRNEIKELRQAGEELDHVISEKDSRIKRLRGLELSAFNANAEKDKEIKDLRDSVRQRDALITVKDKENGQLRVLLGTPTEQVINKKDKQIKQLQADAVHDAKESDKKTKEIKQLRKAVGGLGHVIGEKDKEIKDLQQELATSRDYSDKQADVIRHYLWQIADLKRRLELSEKFSGNKDFHNATEALGNPQYFQGVGDD